MPALRFAGTILLVLSSALCYGQVPPVENAARDPLGPARDWMDAGAYHVARQNLEKIFRHKSAIEQDREVLYLLVQSTFKDQEYEEAYQWSTEFLLDYPRDVRRADLLYIQGTSAYQTHRLDAAQKALEYFLQEGNDNPRHGAGCFWHAMAELDRGDWRRAEDDIRQCFEDSSALAYRDYIIMGWALSLERRGEYRQASEKLQELLSGYPKSELITDARIRLASVWLRLGETKKTLQLLDGTRPQFPTQRQEYLLLQAEASIQLRRYAEARSAYEEFAERFPESVNARKARYGLAWARVKLGDYPGAQREFDSLSRAKDSLAFSAMYQSGVLSILQGKVNAAEATLEDLTSRSPYDNDAASAYQQLGLIQYRAKRYREARRYFQLAARLFPESALRPEAYRMLGESNMAIGDFTNAQHALLQVRKLGAPPELLAPSLFQEGVALYHLGRFKTSAETFSNFLANYPHDPLVANGYVWKGEALYQDGRFGDAERSYSDALRLSPDNARKADASYGLAWSQFEQKKYSQAATTFDRFIREYPENPHVLDASLRRADAYFSLGQYDKASALYASLAGEKSSSAHAEYAAFQLAMSYIQRGDADRGIDQLREFLVRYPNSMYNEVVQFNIAWTYISKEQYDRAIAEFRTLLRFYAESQLMPRVYFNMGDAFYNLKSYDSARVYYQRVISDFPSSLLVTDALSGLQYTYEAEGKPAAAVEEIERVIKEKPAGASEGELLLKKADILFSQNDFAGAIHEYQRLLALKPEKEIRAKALHQLGRSYELEDNPQRAIPFYEQIVSELNDTEVAPAATLALALARIKGKQYQQAVDVLKGFGARYPDSPLLAEVSYQHGVALSNLSDKDAALDQFQSVIQKHPGDVFADRSRLQTALINQDRKKYQAAIDTLAQVVSHRSDDIAAEALLMIGDTYFSMKKTTDAMQAYNDVVRQYADFPRVVERAKLGIGSVYERLKDRKRARSTYDEVARIAVDPAVRKDAQERLKKVRK